MTREKLQKLFNDIHSDVKWLEKEIAKMPADPNYELTDAEDDTLWPIISQISEKAGDFANEFAFENGV